jgi:hypothetical protein
MLGQQEHQGEQQEKEGKEEELWQAEQWQEEQEEEQQQEQQAALSNVGLRVAAVHERRRRRMKSRSWSRSKKKKCLARLEQVGLTSAAEATGTLCYCRAYCWLLHLMICCWFLLELCIVYSGAVC